MKTCNATEKCKHKRELDVNEAGYPHCSYTDFCDFQLPRDSRGKEEINNLMHRINLFDKKVREIAELLGVCYAGVDTDHDSIILAIKELQEDFNLLCRIEKM